MLKKFAACRRGATAIEYAFVALLIAVACIGGIMLLGSSTNNHYGNIQNEVSKAMN